MKTKINFFWTATVLVTAFLSFVTRDDKATTSVTVEPDLFPSTTSSSGTTPARNIKAAAGDVLIVNGELKR